MLTPSSRRTLRLSLAMVVAPVLAAGAAFLGGPRAHAEGGATDQAEANERCAVRLSIALLGKSADDALLASSNPQSSVDAMLASADFADRYARFINSEFNGGPSDKADNDPVYYLAQKIITDGKPWSDLFLGGYDIKPGTNTMTVSEDPNGLGYFRTLSWRRRYGGNEDKGYMLSAAFRILSNTTGLTLIPSVGEPDDDRTASGRAAGACKSCHFDAWFALDKFARLLPMRKGQADTAEFDPPTEGPQQLLGKTLKDDKELVQTLVDSDAFRFNQCRNVFKFLYGREENQCEAPQFDACVDALNTTKTIQSAVAAVAKAPAFCQ